MPGTEVTLGPFTKGLHNSAGTGEFIDDAELFDLVNLEVDTDGSLANRPAFSSLVPGGISGRFKIIGTFFPSGGSRYLVLSYGSSFGTTGLYNIATGSISVSRAIKSNVAVQYKNNIWVVPASDGTAATGGSWDNSGTPVWSGVATMPRGDDACIYKDRLIIAAGIAAPAISDSSVYISCLTHPDLWYQDPLGGITDVKVNDALIIFPETGNGQRTISVLVMNNDLVIFKEHSTFRWTFANDPSKGDLSKISSTIGTPTIKCAVSFDNNNIYLLHDTSVYELYNYTFTKISTSISMTQIADSDVYADSNYGITVFRNRLIVRYYGRQYVFSLLTGRWCRWVSNRKILNVFLVPGFQGLDTIYAHSTSISDPTKLHTMQDDRVINVGISETFNCSLTSKTYDFNLSYAFKVLFWWGMTIATSGSTTVTVQVPNSTFNYTWNQLATLYPSWKSAKDNGVLWNSNPVKIADTTIPPEKGSYARKFLKFNKKLRFRQAFFTVTTPVVQNTVGDSCVRVYDMAVFVNQKETVVARTT